MAVCKVTRRGREVWRARVKIGGRLLTAYRDSKGAAMVAESELLKAHETAGAPQCSTEVPTLAAFADRFMDNAANENGKAEILKKRQMLRDHLLPAFGDRRLDEITAKAIDAYKASKLRALKPATVANHVSVLRRMLNVAVAWGELTSAPKVTQVKIPRQEFDYLSPDEADRFLAAAGEWRTFMLTAIRCGLRQGELRGLQWGDVDLESSRLRIARAFTQTGWELPKSGKARTVDLPWDALAALRDRRPAKAGRTELVFPGPLGKPLDEKAIYNACRRIATAAQIARHVHPHMLRHSMASHHAMAGTPLPVIQSWLGHASISTTMRYSHLLPSTTASYANNAAPARGVTSGVTKL
jgi:integrase